MLPIIDLHCDLLLYLAKAPNAHIEATENIGVTLPYLQAGNVRQQVTAIFALTNNESVAWGQKQLEAFRSLLQRPEFYLLSEARQLDNPNWSEQEIGLTLAIENASILALEEEPLARAFERLDKIMAVGQRLYYITLTHHLENRFGGGNYTQVGLKPDGERLLDYMYERNIPLDLSHTSDQLAHDALNYIDRKNYQLPVLASHSNFRVLRDHPRNLPSELVLEILNRQGIVGANFLRLFLDGERPDSLLDHIAFGLANLPDGMAFGADFFWRLGIPDPARQPLFFPAYEDSGSYPKILTQLAERGIDEQALERLAYGNAKRFFKGVFEDASHD